MRCIASCRLTACLLSLVVVAIPVFSQPPDTHPWTIQEIFGHGAVSTGHPPEEITWSPDGARVSWIDADGNLVALQPPGTSTRVLISSDKIAALLNASIPEIDRNTRARYGEPDYLWSPDSDHILFDTNGQIWLFSLRNRSGVQIASSGMFSRDDPKFSPNGQLISYIRDHNVYAQRPDGSAPIALTSSDGNATLNGEMDWVYPEELDVRSNYFWSPDSRQIAYLQMNESAVPQYPIVDYIPTHVTIDEQRYPQPGDPNPVVRVGVVAVAGGPTRWLRIPLDEGNDYIPRFGWVNPHVVWVEVLSRDHQHEGLWFADVRTGDVRRVLDQTEPKYFNVTYDVNFVDDHTFLILSWRDGHTHIYRYTFNPNNPLADLAQLADQVESGDYEVSSIAAVNPSTQTIWYLSNQGDPRQQQVWSVRFDGGGKHQVSQGSGFHDAVFANQGGAFIDTYSSLMGPPVLSLCTDSSATSGVACTAFWHSHPVEDHALLAPQFLELTASDKTTKLYGTILLPPGKREPHSVPLIVNPYGGPGASTVHDQWGGRRLYFDELLAEHGFAVLHVDNRGMAGRGRDFEQVCYHNFGPPQFADQMASIDQVLRDYPQLDPHRLGWWGWSWGGSFTLFALSHSDSFLAGVAGAPVTDWRDYDSIYTERYMGLPAEDSENYHDDSDVNSAADLRGHILILHGTGDNNVHASNDVQYVQKLIEAGIPYDYNLFPRKMHGVTGADDNVELYTRMLAHFERYLMHPTPEEASRTQPSPADEAH